MTNMHLVPIQQLCVLCSQEVPARDTTQGRAGRLCRAGIRLVRVQVCFRALAQRPKMVRV